VNVIMQAPVLRDAMKRLGGIAPARRLPVFAPRTFKRQFRRRLALEPETVHGTLSERKRVILWADTFNDHFHPDVAAAALEVLEAAGYQVIVPRQSLCCGRPLYDYGFLPTAKRLLRAILDTLADEIRAGTPVVGLEPSCVSVFRDELSGLFPNDEQARRLSRQTFLLSEFLAREGYTPPPLPGKAIVHGHCHQKSVLGMRDEETLLRQMGLEFQVLDSGCCGMAGAFGFERDHFDLSVQIFERALLPAIRTADAETLLITNGFSCREQISQLAGRRTLHVAEVLQMALQRQQKGASHEARETAR
jgi:Fe-S oxidoreductase